MPGLAWLYYFYRQDRYDPEPLGSLARAFLVGGLLVPLVGAVELRLLRDVLGVGTLLPALPYADLRSAVFLVVAPVEELVKFLGCYLAVGRDPAFDEPVDGVVYATATALGFATTENLLYALTAGDQVLLGRGIFSCFLHACCSGLVGYAWGMWRFGHASLRQPALAGLIAVLVHGCYDLVAFGHPPLALWIMGGLLVVVDMGLTARIGRSLAVSPFRPEEGGT